MTLMASVEDPMRKGLIQKITNESLFLKLLHFVQVDGFTYEYGEQSTLGGIAFRGINGTYTADTGIVNPKIENLAIFGGITQVDAAIANLAGGQARANALLAKTRAAGLYFDRMVFQGNPAVTPKSFFGLNTRLTGNQLLVPAADAGNGAAMVLTDVDRLIDAVVGPNSEKILVMCKADRRALKKLILTAAQGAQLTDVGKSLPSYDDVEIHVMDEDGDASPILTKNETYGASSVTSSIYCMRLGKSEEGEWVQGVVNNRLVNHTPMAQISTYIQDLVEMVGGLAIFHGRSAARLRGVI